MSTDVREWYERAGIGHLYDERRNGRRAATVETMTAAHLMGLDLPPIKWAVPGIVPEGVTILAGKPKLGKSWLALGMCISVAAGGYVLGKLKVPKAETLYLSLEGSTRGLRGRLEKMLGGEEPPEGLHFSTEWPRLDEGGLEALDGWLSEHPECVLVVIDTLAKVKPRASGRRNAYDEDRDAVDPLAPLVEKHSVALLLVHHLRKMAAADPLDEINASTGLTAGVDGTLILKRDRGRADAFLYVTGREIEEETELALRWDDDIKSWALAGDASEYRLSQERQEIIALLQRSPGPQRPKEVATALQKNVSTVTNILHKMSSEGLVRTASYGKYELVNPQPGVEVSTLSTLSTDSFPEPSTPEDGCVEGIESVESSTNGSGLSGIIDHGPDCECWLCREED